MSSVPKLFVFLAAVVGVNGDGLIEPTFPLPKNAMSCDAAIETIWHLVKDKRLSASRSLAQTLPPECEKQASKIYIEQADMLLQTLQEERDDGFQQLLTLSLKSDRAQATIDDAIICSIVQADILMIDDYWEKCCSSLWEYSARRSSQNLDECKPDGIPVCCEFFQESPNHLRLPVLRELAIRIRVLMDNWEPGFITLEQDGFLRPFDVSTVLWPAGYFLSLCVAAPIRCGVPEVATTLANRSKGPVAIELGSGVGASSIAFTMAALSGDNTVSAKQAEQPLIIATDNSPQAMALATANIAGNSLSNSIQVERIDHFDLEQVKKLKKSYFGNRSEDGFSLVLGSSLLSFFVDTHQPNAPLWQALDILLHSKPGHRALAVLVHTKVEPVHPPSDGSFRLVRRISGDVFDMKTRSSASSDFELSVFERCDADCQSSNPANVSDEGEL